jgi:hypothetical protein
MARWGGRSCHNLVKPLKISRGRVLSGELKRLGRLLPSIGRD